MSKLRTNERLRLLRRGNGKVNIERAAEVLVLADYCSQFRYVSESDVLWLCEGKRWAVA